MGALMTLSIVVISSLATLYYLLDLFKTDKTAAYVSLLIVCIMALCLYLLTAE